MYVCKKMSKVPRQKWIAGCLKCTFMEEKTYKIIIIKKSNDDHRLIRLWCELFSLHKFLDQN